MTRTPEMRAEAARKTAERNALALEGKRRCTCCNEVKELWRFYNHHTGFMGKHTTCIECIANRNKDRYHAKKRGKQCL